ncbi:MAG: isochorismate synthase [Muriicola sp.]
MPYPKSNSFKHLIEEAAIHFKNKLPGVLFKNPGENSVQAVFQHDARIHEVTNFTERGFVFGPFLKDSLPILIRPDSEVSAVFEAAENKIDPKEIAVKELSSEENRYKKLVEKAIEQIKLGTLKKVVLSRKLEVTTTSTPLEIFQRMLQRYPQAFCYYWFHPKVGTWVGATPEILWSQRGKEFATVALAGTLQKSQFPTPGWGAKEKEEQRLVTSYIKTALSVHVEKMQISDVETIDTGNLYHLKTTISGQYDPGNTKTLLHSLHPTPAVCGMPLEAARLFLLAHENYSRGYYTGYLGELNMGTETYTRLFVNLRCMELKEQKAIIYVGGGITEDSHPDREWEETVAKSKTMLQVV